MMVKMMTLLILDETEVLIVCKEDKFSHSVNCHVNYRMSSYVVCLKEIKEKIRGMLP